MLKRILTIFVITIIITASFFQGYTRNNPVYASIWEDCSTLSEQTEAFIAYCKSRDLTIEGSALDQVTSFSTKAYQNAMRAVGLDINTLQSEIKRTTDGNTGVKFLFSATGANAMNRIFSQFLQDHELSVGDAVDNDIVDSIRIFVFDNGETAEVWTINGNGWSTTKDQSLIEQRGKYLVSSRDAFNSLNNDVYYNYSYSVNGTTYTGNATSTSSSGNALVLIKKYVDYGVNGTTTNVNVITSYDRYWVSYCPGTTVEGGIIVFIDKNTGYLYFGNIGINVGSAGTGSNFKLKALRIQNKTTDNTTTSNVYITTNNNTINNNTYNNNTYTIINNEGDVYNYNDNDEPDPDTPVVPDDPTTPNPPDLPSGDGWDDFTLPEMPNDWLIYGMEKKFPFDIPFNIMFALSLLNHEPVIPHFEGDIDLKVCNWHYDIDLAPFDDIATMLRKFEVLAFIIGLAIMTKELINWG